MNQKNNKYTRWLWLVLLVGYFVYAFISNQTKVPVPEVGNTPTAVVQGVATDAPAQNTVNVFPVYFTAPILPYDGRKTGGIEDNLIKLIDGAKTSVDLAVFEFDLEDVAAALIRAEARGVKVRVVHDNEHTAPDPQIGELASAGIPTIPDDRSAYMHNKFFVIDNLCVWTGSFNLSVNAAFKNNENAVVICDENLADNYEAEFGEMYAGQFGPKSPVNTPHPEMVIDGVSVENYFAPEDDVMSKVVAAVSAAESSVHFVVFSFTDEELANTMIGLINRGIPVSGVFESRGANAKSSACLVLLANKADIGLDGNPYTFHHKVIIIDGRTVIFGSFNFSANANEQNDENLLIVHSVAFAQKFEQEFQRMKDQSTAPQNGECSN